jgi:hypothetical protein
MLDYHRLSPVIGGGSLSLKANERTRERERGQVMRKCIDCDTPVDPSGLIRCDECLFLFIVNYKSEGVRA